MAQGSQGLRDSRNSTSSIIWSLRFKGWGFRVWGCGAQGFMIWGLGCSVLKGLKELNVLNNRVIAVQEWGFQGLGVYGSGFQWGGGVQFSGFGVWGVRFSVFGCRVQGAGCRV